MVIRKGADNTIANSKMKKKTNDRRQQISQKTKAGTT